MEKSVLAVIVIYNPEEILLLRNIRAIIKFIDHLLIWNNSPDNYDAECLKDLSDKIEVKHVEKNIGISKALNAVLRYAKENGYDYLLTMDQDSVWINFEGFLQKVFSLEDTMHIFGPEYCLTDEETIREYEYRITSGMFLPVALLDKIGGYYEDFEIDGIAVELCYRAREHGYKVYNISGSTLEHHAGSNLQCRFLWHSFFSDGYSPKRIYGIIRNHLIIYRRFNVGKRERDDTFWYYYVKMPIKILLGEEGKIKKILSYVMGLYRGLVDNYVEINNLAE